MSQPNETIIPIEMEGNESTINIDNTEGACALSATLETTNISNKENNNSNFTEILNKKNINDIQEFKPKMTYSRAAQSRDFKPWEYDYNNYRLPREDVISVPRFHIKTLVDIDQEQNHQFHPYTNFKGQLTEFDDIMKKIDKPYVWEKVVLIIDCAEEEDSTPFNIKNRHYSGLDAIKKQISIYLNQKKNAGAKRPHEFAVIVMTTHSAYWYVDFTRDIDFLKRQVRDLVTFPVEDVYDFDTVFERLQDVPWSDFHKKPHEDTPIYTLHPIIFYNRSYTIPVFSDCYLEFLENPLIALDVIMTHEPEGIGNKVFDICKVFKQMQKINYKNYFFPITRNSNLLEFASNAVIGNPDKRGLQVIEN